MVPLCLTLDGDLDQRLVFRSAVGDDLEWPQLQVCLDNVVHKLSANQALGVKDGVPRVVGNLVLGSIPYQALVGRPRHVGRGGPVALVVGNDLHLAIFVDTDAGVRRAEIDADGRGVGELRLVELVLQGLLLLIVVVAGLPDQRHWPPLQNWVRGSRWRGRPAWEN
mmetsp:Transcript_74839/g.198832  ORF Transcript_74839/g.198832 Transcript_74839/m.198832 type:complete len:166 (-) Transcript_74839:14-511(-)